MSKTILAETPAIADLAAQKQAIHLQGVSPRYRGVFKAAYAGKSRKSAISAFCLNCIGLDPDEIRRCTAPACPLWAVRPYCKPVLEGGIHE